MSYHKEKGRSQIIEDEKDKEKMRNFLSTCIHPFDNENHPAKIVNIRTGKLSNEDVNVDKCVEIGSEQVKNFHQTLPESFTTRLVSRLKLCIYFRKAFK